MGIIIQIDCSIDAEIVRWVAMRYLLSEMIVRNILSDIPLGNNPGRCVVCGRNTQYGYPVEFSDSFMNANLLQVGEVLCEFCNTAVHMKSLRTSMWMVTPEQMRFFKRDEAKNIICNPPEPPFAIYITESYKKTGWQAMTARSAIAESRDVFPVGFDYNIVIIHRQDFQKYLDTIRQLLDMQISKNELRSGRLRISTIKRHGIEWARDVTQYLSSRVDNPIWNLAVYIS